jgi:ABC-type sugar transport system ATPase subunit
MDDLLDAVDIAKEFGGFHALSGVSLRLRRGSVHAVVGENGAGKSTLMKVIAGVYAPSSGVLRFKGREVAWGDADDARRSGISTIFQEFILLPNLSVAENLHLGREPRLTFGRLDRARMADEASAALARLGASINPARLVSTLSVAEQQLVEIGKGLMRDADVFVFDEPTAALGDRETERLFALIRDLQAAGKGILYVSHRLPEVFALCDTVTVLKDGALIETIPIAEATPEGVVTAMVGRKLSLFFPEHGKAADAGEVVLAFDNVAGDELPGPVNFVLRRREIVGLAGLEGHGQRAILRSIFGESRIKAGEIRLFDKRLEVHEPRGAILSGFGLIPEDRKRQGLFLTLSVEENVGIGCQVGVELWRIARNTAQQFAEQVRELSVRLASPDQPVTDLSGGNQQKTLLARWLARGVSILVCEEPTRGVDVGAKAEIYRILRRLADSGTPVLIASRELPELIGLCDRIVVLRDGETVGTVPAEGATEDSIMRVAAGAT